MRFLFLLFASQLSFAANVRAQLKPVLPKQLAFAIHAIPLTVGVERDRGSPSDL